ncbi:MAG TPA: mechanosensitive ion channel family protein [Steroidobacteraceae bacterium]|jgi:small-conductance mechanosensitive channel
MQIDDFLSLPLFRNSALEWLIAAGLTAAVLAVMLLARRLVRRHHQRLLTTDRVEWLELPLEVLSRTTLVFFVVLALFLGLRTLDISAATRTVIISALTVALFLQAGIWATAAVTAWFDRKQRSALAHNQAAAGSLGILAFIAQGVVWALVVLLTLDNLGVNITALVAGLGVGGVAVALAVQNILGDLFASLSITFDRPFVLGDFLIVGDFMGNVEHIGIKSTRLRSLSGEQIIMSNADLLKSRVRNYGRMRERRVIFTIGVTYETTADTLEQIPQTIRAVIAEQPSTRFDRCHFAAHGAASLDFETVYYVLSADYNQYMDIQQRINLRVHREFERMGVEFAYPTQRLLLERTRARAGEAQTSDRAA